MSTENKKFEYEIGEGLEALPERSYRKGSKFDIILEQAQKMEARYHPVRIEGKDANYIRTQLFKRIAALRLTGVGVTVANGVCYIEKDKLNKPKPKK